MQGFSFGGEIGPATAYLLEAAPDGRRGIFVSLQFAGEDLVMILAGIVGLSLTAGTILPAGTFWTGWRGAFLLGACAMPLGLWLRHDRPETLTAISAMPADRHAARTDLAAPRRSISHSWAIMTCLN